MQACVQMRMLMCSPLRRWTSTGEREARCADIDLVLAVVASLWVLLEHLSGRPAAKASGGAAQAQGRSRAWGPRRR
eukprot:6196022-Pleurochrysis_carterae.AAC.1